MGNCFSPPALPPAGRQSKVSIGIFLKKFGFCSKVPAFLTIQTLNFKTIGFVHLASSIIAELGSFLCGFAALYGNELNGFLILLKE